MIYLLHFSAPLGDPDRPHMSASHYLGYAEDVDRRLELHRSGKGPSITAAAVARGIELLHVWTRPGGREDERRYKRAGHFADRLCDICRGGATTRCARGVELM